MDKQVGKSVILPEKGELIFNKSHNYFKSEQSMGYSADRYVYLANPFEVYLPKGIVNISIQSHIIAFYYLDKQMIIINGGLSLVKLNGEDVDKEERYSYRNKQLTKDSIDNEDFYFNAYSYSNIGSEDLLVSPTKERKTVIYKNDSDEISGFENIRIVFYNIKQENLELIENYVNTFKFL